MSENRTDVLQSASEMTRKSGLALRELRLKRKLSFGEVERRTRKIAVREKNQSYVVTKARLTQIETGSEPGPRKLLALAEVYSVKVKELLDLWR